MEQIAAVLRHDDYQGFLFLSTLIHYIYLLGGSMDKQVIQSDIAEHSLTDYLMRQLAQISLSIHGLNEDTPTLPTMPMESAIAEYAQHIEERDKLIKQIIYHLYEILAVLNTVIYIAKTMLITKDKQSLIIGIDDELTKLAKHWQCFAALTYQLACAPEIVSHMSKMIDDFMTDLMNMQDGRSNGELIRQYIETDELDDFYKRAQQIRAMLSGQRFPRNLDLETEYFGTFLSNTLAVESDYTYWELLELLKAQLEEKSSKKQTEINVLGIVLDFHERGDRRGWRSYAKEKLNKWANRTNPPQSSPIFNEL